MQKQLLLCGVRIASTREDLDALGGRAKTYQTIGTVHMEKGKTMYDELVKRMRAQAEVERFFLGEGMIYDEAADAIEELQQVAEHYEQTAKDYWKESCDYKAQIPNWIPVTERLPEHAYGESTSVLTVDLYGVMRAAYFDGGNWCLPSGDALTTMRVAPITHWMPLPRSTKEET